MHGIVAYGTHLPVHRLELSEIGRTLGGSTAKGGRFVAGYDEDTTSMAVEAARCALAGIERAAIGSVLLATAQPAYLDRANAAIVHAALSLPTESLALDYIGSMRTAAGALLAAAEHRAADGHTLAVFSDVRTGLPGSVDEQVGSDGAAAIVVGDDTESLPVIAEFIGSASRTEEVLDRWRIPGDSSSHVWEERFAEGPLVAAGMDALRAAASAAEVAIDGLDHLLVVGMHDRAVRGVVKAVKVTQSASANAAAAAASGSAGTAQIAVGLAEILDNAGPDETIGIVVLGDGAVAVVARTTAAVATHRNAIPVSRRRETSRPVSYPLFLTWRGRLDREPPRRPDPVPPAAPPSFRAASYKFGLNVGRCTECGTVNIPVERICIRCHEVDTQVLEPLSEKPGKIVTFTVDHLAFSPSPPVVSAVVDFEGGGRMVCEVTDAGLEGLEVGASVTMTFRRMSTSGGIHNYFWKARPADNPISTAEPDDSELEMPAADNLVTESRNF
ncbi:OB-fold domain-containing protein [Rhodococcus opacus]|uniref:Hydroxymethylglutaryl-CoA synthase n=1 Tax=Rhodococcus opacus TaxID=37919 RepID=A0A2S8J4R9_RHOOP|nr:OB-fold domain-containing protein [Rhodococcus opacus]PQP21995.1 hydroxymethylglutaryl-CoA synthase [Rhodococcus opacus]